MRRPTLLTLVSVFLTAGVCAAAATTPLARVWVDAYGFARGETLPLRDAVEVREWFVRI